MNMNIMILEDLIFRLNKLEVKEEDRSEVKNIIDIIADVILDLKERIDEENK